MMNKSEIEGQTNLMDIEAQRIETVHRLGIMDNPQSQAAYDRITRLAQSTLDGDFALISFQDGQRQWYKSSIGIAGTENRKELSFCVYAVDSRRTFAVSDASKDPRFIDNDLVTGDHQVRSYLGAPIVTDVGHAVGTICIYGRQEREFTDKEKRILEDLAELVLVQIKIDRNLAYREASTHLPNRAKFLVDSASSLPVRRRFVLAELMSHDEIDNMIGAFGFEFFYHQVKYAAAQIAAELNGTTVYDFGGARLAFELPQTANDIRASLQSLKTRLQQPFQSLLGTSARLRPVFAVRAVPPNTVIDSDVMRALLNTTIKARTVQDLLWCYNAEDDTAQQRRFKLLSDYPAALAADDQLFLTYQPRTNRAGEWIGAEALLRWQHPEFGLVSPGEFIPLIEKTGLIQETTDWVFNATFRQLREWRSSGFFMKCSFNISARNLEEPDFVDRLVNALQVYELPPLQVEIEIVESMDVPSTERMRARLRTIAELGITIAIDDFGTGYSNLSHLLELPARVLKLDRSITSNVIDRRANAAMIKGLVKFAHGNGFDVVAEGVETEALSQALLRLGCDELQGYYISRPLPAESFRRAAEAASLMLPN